jgi:hypothetical protein
MSKQAAFEFSPRSRRKDLFKFNPTKVTKLQDQSEQPPFFIRGIQAASKDEYWASLALEIIEKQTGWGWDYQVPVYGGRRRRGGNVIDFLVYTPGRWTMIDPKGRYWHTGAREDQQEMRNVAREKNWNLIEYFTDETPTKEAVLSRLKQEMHV